MSARKPPMRGWCTSAGEFDTDIWVVDATLWSGLALDAPRRRAREERARDSLRQDESDLEWQLDTFEHNWGGETDTVADTPKSLPKASFERGEKRTRRGGEWEEDRYTEPEHAEHDAAWVSDRYTEPERDERYNEPASSDGRTPIVATFVCMGLWISQL
jgi:hypothetical protein